MRIRAMRFLIFSLLYVLTACGQSNNKINQIDPRAKRLKDSASLIAMSQQEYSKAISLLDQAIALDSNYLAAYRNKLTFQLELRQFEQATKTASKISQLRPDNPDYYVTIGILYDVQGDTVKSKDYFKRAISQYDRIFDTIAVSNINYDMLLMNKALNLIFIGEQNKGNDILKQLYNKQIESPFKEILASYLNKSKQDILKMMMSPNTGKVEANAN